MSFDPLPSRDGLIAVSEQPAVEPPRGDPDAPIGFFVIGIIVNLALIAAYFVWAWRQSRRPGKGDD